MSDSYAQLLDAVISHLQDMKARGIQYVEVSSDALNVLKTQGQKIGRKESLSSTATAAQRSVSPATLPSLSHSTDTLLPKKPIKQEHFREEASHEMKTEQSSPLTLPRLDPEAKAAAFVNLNQRAMACVKCQHLANSRKNVVFGVGNINSELMFVGEAPGADEDAQGEPFVGRAGQLLTKIIETMGLNRGSVYIANILKCRPDTPGQPTGNRKPTLEEMQTCIPFLHEQIDLIQPKVIVALGATAIEGLLGKTAGITRLRGTWHSYRSIPLMPTYHPAYLLRNQGPTEKRRVWEDMLQVMERLGMPITEKQRNFFKGT